jgi:hypothetical protein
MCLFNLGIAVNFFGPNDEYIISGSARVSIFFWDKETEAIVNVLEHTSISRVSLFFYFSLFSSSFFERIRSKN